MRDYIEYLRIPYLHQGRSMKGADCFGLVRLFYSSECQVELPDFTEDYPVEWWGTKNYFLDLYKEYNFERVEGVQPHDILMFRNSITAVGHIGIALDDENFIHMGSSGCCIANYSFSAWKRQLHSVYRYNYDHSV